jgi:hypothetical protein
MKHFGFAHRFPTLRENLQVYAVVAVPLYAWTILWLFWEVPSWLNFLTLGEILPIFAYALTTNLLESLLILAGLNIFCVVLPKHWFRDLYVARSFLFILPGLSYLMYFASLFRNEVDPPPSLLVWLPVILVLSFAVGVFLSRHLALRNYVERIADRLTVFLYLIVPLSILSFVLVIVRNVG